MAEVEHDDQCEQEFINPPGAYGPCGCAHRAEGLPAQELIEVEPDDETKAANAEAYEWWRSQQ